ncbi:hypothetical protein ACP6L2_03825 [Sphingobacterium lactis]|uniref:hypothetical protein n=1 Tax=Sphingobacterium lactis TaxID=797291 RepID=UPI003F7FC82B
MGRYSIVNLIENATVLSISDIKKWGYLETENKSGVITWSRNGKKTSAISIRTVINTGTYLELSYTYQKTELVKYLVEITYIESNLKNGEIPYFICPSTGKRCRKLYSIGKYFLHREAYYNTMYEKQTESKKMRNFTKIMGPYYEVDKVNEELYSKHFKNFYNGKPTKRFVRLMKKLNKVDRNFNYGEFIRKSLTS